MKRRAIHAVIVRRIALATIGIVTFGCVTPPPEPDAETLIADATRSSPPILFTPDDESIDAPSSAPEVLTREEAIRRAILGDARLQALLARVRMALADAEQTRLLPNPILEVAYRFPTVSDAPDEIEVGVTAELLPLLTRPGRSRAADDRLRGTVSDAIDRALDVVALVRSRYAAVQAFEELIPSLNGRRDLLGRLRTVAQERLDAGEGIRLDVTSLRTQEAELDLDLLELARDRADARLELAQLMGVPSERGDWKVEPREAPTPVPVEHEARWIEAALASRPDIEAIRWELVALKEEAQLAGLSILEGAGAGISAEKAEDWSIGPAVSIPIPLFDFGQARRARAEASLIEARHRLLETRRVAVSEVRRALVSYAALQQSVERLRDVVLPLQRQRREEIEAIYLGGQADITSLIIAEQELRLSQVKLIGLEERIALSRAALERAVGGPAAALRVETETRESDSGERP
ncbi:MAG: TolC family protein [Planctomycetes bacterium]|nr:TolC family protein [Planctomycetota bacterium]